MKSGVFYLQKMMNFMKPGVFYLQKMMNCMKMRTFYKKLPLFIKNSILHTYKKLKPLIWAFIKNSIFENNRDPCISVLAQYTRRILIHSARIKHHLFKQKAIVSGHYKHKYNHPSHLPDEPVQHFLLHITVPGKLLSVMFCPKLGETKRFPPILNHMGRKISWVAHDFCQSKLP